MSSWLTEHELNLNGFHNRGKNCLISRNAVFYNTQYIKLGNNVRIDDFCLISAQPSGIEIGSQVHIAAYVQIAGAGGITIGDFTGVSSRTSLLSSNDDYTGQHLAGPCVKPEHRGVESSRIHIGRHCLIGSGSLILPAAVLEDGVAIGAQSLVPTGWMLAGFNVWAGTPVKIIKKR